VKLKFLDLLDTEMDESDFPLDPSQAFLILGKGARIFGLLYRPSNICVFLNPDGADLLSISRKYNVHVSFSANPLSLKVEGLRGSLDNLGQYIVKFKDVSWFPLLSYCQ
jgi:hypothetical protein